MSNSDENGAKTDAPKGLVGGPPTGDLDARIRAARQRGGYGEYKTEPKEHLSGHAKAARLGTEFIAAIIVGGFIGYFADMGLGTSPWLLLVMVLVGFVAGVMNVVRSAARMNAEAIITPKMDLGPDTHRDDADGK
ncbi:AtpZ/AtpI family protein [Maritalea mediterranea]|uniref:AtpZ/AtpI family protein n=1 Tax=Maritalea mediterranea TaxID=2909667 RepID=A0ABS9E4M4_9HYPH|nr:AtpZ/AtpI family protein [Maritalea mediterranea]MCF4097821.1 AtpZ/AtpI family protein [Maritalea mediterranea]